MNDDSKERLRQAADVLMWMADGKAIVIHSGTYRLKPVKTQRPFTEQEARRLIGCVLVSPSGERSLCTDEQTSGSLISMLGGGWHYHLPGDPNNLNPCWVEEEKEGGKCEDDCQADAKA